MNNLEVDMEDAKTAKECKKLYSGLGWISFFTSVRFITGSFVQLEKFIPKNGKILDLGCGYGILSNYLTLCSSKRKIIGVDTDYRKIKYANRGYKNVSLNIGDATKMKYNDFDCVILHNVLHHLNSYQQQDKLIADCIKMLNKNGILFIIEIDKHPFWKLFLCRITDFLLYKGDPVYYRYKEQMLSLLKSYFLEDKIQVKNLDNNPFPQVLYICQKK